MTISELKGHNVAKNDLRSDLAPGPTQDSPDVGPFQNDNPEVRLILLLS
jgi:hypothetical protein